MGRKKKNQIRVKFCGKNSEDVTGSCTHIQMDEKQILLECGMFQSCGSIVGNYKINSMKFEFKPKEINYIFISHCHIDHIGLLPRLYEQGCKAQIIAPFGTYDLAKILLNDSAHIVERDTEIVQRRTGKSLPLLFKKETVNEVLNNWTEFELNSLVELDKNVSFIFRPSGHIINSAQIELWLRQNNQAKKVVYTGDLGNISVPKYYTNKFFPIEKANLLIAETTYCDKQRNVTLDNRKLDLLKIKSVINEVCIENKNKVLIPCFANDRLQNILTFLYDIFGEDENFNAKILVDSPMAIKICNLYKYIVDNEQMEKYKKVISWEKIQWIENYEDSKYYQDRKEPMIILASSGMITAGRSVSWVTKLLPNPNNHILFCGYTPPDSIAGKIKSGNSKTISIEGKAISNRCNITALTSFSSHIQYDDMLNYYSNINADKIALVHGNFTDKCNFAKVLQEIIFSKSKTGKVISVNHSTEIIL